jgi:hypothetical protein
MARSRYDLSEPANSELIDFCQAMDGATQKTVLSRALSEYVERMLDENEGIRKRYEILRRARREHVAPNMRLIKDC